MKRKTAVQMEWERLKPRKDGFVWLTRRQFNGLAQLFYRRGMERAAEFVDSPFTGDATQEIRQLIRDGAKDTDE